MYALCTVTSQTFKVCAHLFVYISYFILLITAVCSWAGWQSFANWYWGRHACWVIYLTYIAVWYTYFNYQTVSCILSCKTWHANLSTLYTICNLHAWISYHNMYSISTPNRFLRFSLVMKLIYKLFNCFVTCKLQCFFKIIWYYLPVPTNARAYFGIVKLMWLSLIKIGIVVEQHTTHYTLHITHHKYYLSSELH